MDVLMGLTHDESGSASFGHGGAAVRERPRPSAQPRYGCEKGKFSVGLSLRAKMTSILPNPSGNPPIYGKLMWIVFFAFALRVAVRWLTGESNFWENGYTFFFALAQNI